MPTREPDSVRRPTSPDGCPPVAHQDISSLLRPLQIAAPALFMALNRCLHVLHSGDMGEARLSAIAEAENALRLVERNSVLG